MIGKVSYKQLEPTLKAIIDKVPADTQEILNGKITELISDMCRAKSRITELQAKGYKTSAQIGGEILAGRIKPHEGSVKIMDPLGERTGLVRLVKDENGRYIQIIKPDDLNHTLLVSDGKANYEVSKYTVNDFSGNECCLYKEITALSDGTHYKYARRMIPEERESRLAIKNASKRSYETRFLRETQTTLQEFYKTLKEAVEQIRKVDKQ